MFELQPSTLLVGIFLVLFIKHAVGFVGKANIQNRAWTLYTIVAAKAGHPKIANLQAKRLELVKINKERRAISAQDQYAKWTKLNRQFDSLSAEVESLGNEMSAEKAQFTKLVNFALLALTSGPIWFSRYWYRKNALFYLRPGAVPAQLEWFLAFPFMPSGAVGLTVWMFAVNSVLSSAGFLVEFLSLERVEKPIAAPKVSEVPKVEEVDSDAQVPVDVD